MPVLHFYHKTFFIILLCQLSRKDFFFSLFATVVPLNYSVISDAFLVCCIQVHSFHISFSFIKEIFEMQSVFIYTFI